MRKLTQVLIGAIACVGFLTTSAGADHIWINEFNYDDPGNDNNEFVEVAIRTPNGSGFNPANYMLEFYNGSGGELYGSTGTLNTFATINMFPVFGSTDTITLYAMVLAPGATGALQNGSPDGIALVNVANSTVESFLSYEGSFTATASGGGIAGTAGAISTEVSASQGSSQTPSSLSATGAGDDANNFTAGSFVETAQTIGAPNAGQVFTAVVIPEPGSMGVLSIASLAGLCFRRRK